MKPEIKTRFSAEMLTELTSRYGISPDQLTALDGFESFIYRYDRGEQGLILRIGHSSRRGEALVRGEIDWIRFLAAEGAGVARPVKSDLGHHVERIDDGSGEAFIAAAFQEADGKLPDEHGWSEELMTAYGRAIGRMHRLSTRYKPADPLGFRPDWNHPAINDVAENLHHIDLVAVDRWTELETWCRSLPTLRDAYGLIHFDAHALNFFVNDTGQITFFDFDDCNYNWFAADIAILLFYRVMWAEDRAAATRAFLKPFLSGYREEFNLQPRWFETIPHFLKMREIDLYGVIHRSFDLETEDDPWITGFMAGRKEAIHTGSPYIPLDFSEFVS